MTARTAIAVALWGWFCIGVCLYIVHQFEPVPPLAPASDSLWLQPVTVESGANFATQPARPSSAPGWVVPTDNNSKGR